MVRLHVAASWGPDPGLARRRYFVFPEPPELPEPCGSAVMIGSSRAPFTGKAGGSVEVMSVMVLVWLVVGIVLSPS